MIFFIQLNEGSGEIFKPQRGEQIEFDIHNYPELAEEFYDLIAIAYQELGGFAKISKPSDILNDPDWNYWGGIDIHKSPDFDIIFFGKRTKFGMKYVGVGHDGSREAKGTFLNKQSITLQKLGYYVEVSGKIANILIKKYNAPIVTNQKDVEKVLGIPVEWIGQNNDDLDSVGNSWYRRKIGASYYNKIMLGRPNI